MITLSKAYIKSVWPISSKRAIGFYPSEHMRQEMMRANNRAYNDFWGIRNLISIEVDKSK